MCVCTCVALSRQSGVFSQTPPPALDSPAPISLVAPPPPPPPPGEAGRGRAGPGQSETSARGQARWHRQLVPAPPKNEAGPSRPTSPPRPSPRAGSCSRRACIAAWLRRAGLDARCLAPPLARPRRSGCWVRSCPRPGSICAQGPGGGGSSPAPAAMTAEDEIIRIAKKMDKMVQKKNAVSGAAEVGVWVGASAGAPGPARAPSPAGSCADLAPGASRDLLPTGGSGLARPGRTPAPREPGWGCKHSGPGSGPWAARLSAAPSRVPACPFCKLSGKSAHCPPPSSWCPPADWRAARVL